MRVSLLQVEIPAIAGGALALVLLAATPLRWLYFPDVSLETLTLLTLDLRLVVSILYAGFVCLGAAAARAVLRKDKNLFTWAHVIMALRICVSLTVCGMLYVNFKLWAHLLQPERYDALYAALDQPFVPMLKSLEWWLYMLNIPGRFYFTFFVLIFPLSLLVSALHSIHCLHRTATGIAWAVIIGAACYMLAPAYGPFIDQQVGLLQKPFLQSQARMLAFTEGFRLHGGSDFQASQIITVLGAMPSLHVALSAMIAWQMWRVRMWLGVVFSVIALYIFIFSWMTRYHYFVDSLAGLLIFALSRYLTQRAFASETRLS